jgi:hypothetical protein
MRMFRICLVAALAAGLFSCNTPETKTEDPAEIAINQPTAPADVPNSQPEDLTPDAITKLPEKIEGCTALFADSPEAYAKKKYVFVHNLQGAGFLTIDGKTIEMTLAEKSDLPGGAMQEIFSTNQYKVILTTRKVKQTGYEVTAYEGTLEIYKDVSELKLKVVGEAGC